MKNKKAGDKNNWKTEWKRRRKRNGMKFSDSTQQGRRRVKFYYNGGKQKLS